MEFRKMVTITLYARQRKRDTDVQNRLLDSMGEGEGGMIWENSIETCILSGVKQFTSPGWMHEASARGWCTGKTQRDGMGREVGGGFRMGNTCTSLADSCQCMAKTTTIKKKIKKKISYFFSLVGEYVSFILHSSRDCSCCSLVVKSCVNLLQPHGLHSTRLICPWDFPGKYTGVGCHALLQGFFPTQG